MTTFTTFWWSTSGVLTLWALLTLGVCVLVRSGKVIWPLTAARQNVLLGLSLVLLSVSASAYCANQLSRYKVDHKAEKAQSQAELDRLNDQTQQKRCARLATQDLTCEPAKPSYDLAANDEPVFEILGNTVEVIGVLLGLLGGALGVNILTDGLLKKDPPRYSPVRARDIRVTRTLGLKGWRLEHVTVRSYPASSDEKAEPPIA
ncbi:hypothetical protein RJC98_09660 [Pseudomonas allii]|uniref:Uncharacterized protein n=1 Tax=Pseudomonas allii TaxID=2740531 RepID=A0ACC6LB13_9PSED|nr:hypothetical protein [Pseudomonas allii]MDR9875449.1 hypothetical protein [Pseudomonas allii]